MFVFNYLEKVSDYYHAGGGLAVVAEDEAHVKVLVEADEHVTISDKEWEKVSVYELKNEEKPKIFVFPDAGCC